AVHHHSHIHHDYYWVDPDFIDPTFDNSSNGSLTYTLSAIENHPQGLAESLLELFSAYGLSLYENRHFILDDSSWPWGSWTDYFLPQSKSPLFSNSQKSPSPPMLPCPRTSHHLQISHATHTFIFGHAFTDHFELPQFSGSARQKRIFQLVESGYKALFHLQPALETEAKKRIRQLTETAGAGEWLVIHVRRGDYVPRTWAWHEGVIPLEVFVDFALGMGDAGNQARVAVVSDDGEVPGAPQLAGSYAVAGMGGMKGGYRPQELIKMTVEERVTVGREFLIQLRVVAELAKRGGVEKGGVLCAGGSATCRLLAVMLGWEKAIENERWKDIDGDMGWWGVDW
ncbi:hypothetical protein BZA77DRAFT_245206, partial [Pyronema omphalodes]